MFDPGTSTDHVEHPGYDPYPQPALVGDAGHFGEHRVLHPGKSDDHALGAGLVDDLLDGIRTTEVLDGGR